MGQLTKFNTENENLSKIKSLLYHTYISLLSLFIVFPRDQYVDKTPSNNGRVAIQSNRTEINPQTNVANACNSEAFEEMAAPCIIPSSHPSLDLNDDYWLMRQNSGRAAVQNNKFEINPEQNAANVG